MPKQKSSYHHKDLKNALIDAAIPLLKEKGVVGLSMRELAAATGVSHGAPYRHYPDLNALLEAIAARGFENLQQVCEAAVEHYPDDPVAALEEAGIGYIQFVNKNPEIAALMFGGVLKPEQWGESLNRSATQAFGSLAIIIAAGKQQGLYADFDLNDLTITSLATVHGLAMFYTGGMIAGKAKSKKALTDMCRRVYRIMLDGMLSRD